MSVALLVVNAPSVIFIHGPPASGKLTIAKELSAATGFALFHNHLTVDMLLALFPFGSAPFVHHRERLWMDLIGEAVTAGTSLIFTFNPERTVSPSFPDRLRQRVEQAGGRILFVEVRCAGDEIERRIEASSRRDFKKLGSVALYRELRDSGAFDYPAITADCAIDSSLPTPAESASKIMREFKLQSKSSACV